MQSTFLPNRICERQSCQNRHTALKFSSKRENSALFLKILPNVLFRSCAARFGQIAFLSVKVLKIVTRAWNSLQKGKTVHFPWELDKTLVSCHAQHVFAKSHFRASKFLKSSNWPKIVLKTRKLCAFHHNCTKHSFQVMRSTFWPNRFLEGQSSQNRYTSLKFSSKRENSALSMKIVQNVLFRSCAARFGQIAFWRVKVLKIVTLLLNSLQNEKTVRFPWKLYKTFFSGHAQHVLAKSHLWASKLSKSSHWPQILSKKVKQCAFHKIQQNSLFRSCRARFCQIAFVRVEVVKIVTLHSNSLQNGKTVRFSWKFYQTFFSGHAQHAARFGQIACLSVKVLKIVTRAWNSLQKGKTVRFP